MSLWWCRTCGMESVRGLDACPTCGAAMQQANIEWLNPGDEGEETVFELEPEPIERAAIVDALIHENIRHRWESDGELVVADPNADTVDGVLDEVLGVETRDEDGAEEGNGEFDLDDLDDLDGDDIDDDDEPDQGEGYEALSQLYVAVDRMQNSRHSDEIMQFASATGVILMTPPPFGIDDETWADIQAAARNAATALEGDADAPVDADLKALRNQLHMLV